jgi:membrane protease YdiL (CAAX protease family)
MLRGAYFHLNQFGKLFLLLILVFCFLLFSALTGILALVPFYGTEVLSMLTMPDYSNPSVVNALKVIQIFNMAGGLLLPAIIYFWLVTPPGAKIMGLTGPVHLVSVILSVMLIIISQPIIGLASEFNSALSLPGWLHSIESWMKDKEELGRLLTEAFLSTTTIKGLLINVFMIALLPAFAEEILFRGVLATFLKDWTRNLHWAVFISAFIFSAIHLQFFGFLPRLLLGIALGYLYFWSGSLWLPIAAHFANNFLSVLVEFLYRKQIIHTNAENLGTNSTTVFTLISLVGIFLIFYYLKKRQQPENAE